MRREYKGAAQSAQLTTNLGGSTADKTIVCTDLTNWPTGSIGPFFVVIDRGKTNEEKILCVSRSGNTLTVYDTGGVNGRGADDTSISAHTANAVIEHVFTKTDADEANSHVNNPAVHWTVCTSSTRPTSPVTNMVILETDTLLAYAYVGGNWQQITSTLGADGLSPFLLMGA